MPVDWRDVRFDTGARMGGNDKAMLRQTVNNNTWGGPRMGDFNITGSILDFPALPESDFNNDLPVDDDPRIQVIINLFRKIANGFGSGIGLPDWFVLAGDGVDNAVSVTGTTLDLLLQGLPTVDPGGGLAWVSAS